MKKYMAFDLITLAILGFGLEWLCISVGSNVIIGIPTIAVSLLVVFIGTVRWNFGGLVLIPIVVAGMLVGGKTCGIVEFSQLYDWRIYLSTVVGFIVMAINPILYIKFGTKKLTDALWKVMLIMVINYVLIVIIETGMYRILTVGSPFTPTDVVSQTESRVFTFDGSFTYNLLGLALSGVGLAVLKSQGIVCNVKQKSIDDRKNAELDRKDREFRIEDSEGEEDGAPTSSNESNSDAEKQNE